MKLNTKFGEFGGVYIPEMMVAAMETLENSFIKYINCFNYIYNSQPFLPTKKY